MADRDEAPPITACKLYEKTSKAGNIYLTGRLGGLRVLIFKTRELADDGVTPIWELKLAQAAPYEKKPAPTKVEPASGHDDGIDIANEGPSQPIEDLDDF